MATFCNFGGKNGTVSLRACWYSEPISQNCYRSTSRTRFVLRSSIKEVRNGLLFLVFHCKLVLEVDWDSGRCSPVEETRIVDVGAKKSH